MRIKPIILSGGAGVRLWPVSTEQRPKQMIALMSAETMLQSTIRRVANRQLFAPASIVAAEVYAESVAEQIDQISADLDLLVLEPVSRNTAPAIALAAFAYAEDDLLLVMPSDHVIDAEGIFVAAVEAAIPTAKLGKLVTFGVRAESPETGYGYIQRGREIATNIFAVERFIEKPNAPAAASYVAAGTYEWNAGIFLFRAGTYLDAVERFAPQVAQGSRRAMQNARRSGVRLLPDAAAFATCPSISIDHAVLEKADNVAVAPLDVGWSDIGSWEAIYRKSRKDLDGNSLTGNIVSLDTENCILRSDGPLVAAIGVKDLAIVVANGAVLVVPLCESQRVREILQAISKANLEDI